MGMTMKGRQFRERFGPWAVVTGASDGIGREFALCLADAGVDVVLVARGRQRLEAVAAEVAARGARSLVHVADLANPAEVESLARATKDLQVGLLVAAAGFGTSGNLIEHAVS